MSDPFVVDASVGVGWIHPSQATELTRRSLGEARTGAAVYVPGLWHLEMANSLLVFVRRKLMTEPQREAGLALLSRLTVFIDDETSRLAFSKISELAVKYSLSVYDAAYMDLAVRKSLPLATRDESLRTAAKKTGIKLF